MFIDNKKPIFKSGIPSFMVCGNEIELAKINLCRLQLKTLKTVILLKIFIIIIIILKI